MKKITIITTLLAVVVFIVAACGAPQSGTGSATPTTAPAPTATLAKQQYVVTGPYPRLPVPEELGYSEDDAIRGLFFPPSPSGGWSEKLVIRDRPWTTGSPVGAVALQHLTILEQVTGEEITYSGLTSNLWRKVQSGGYTGYVWAPLLQVQ